MSVNNLNYLLDEIDKVKIKINEKQIVLNKVQKGVTNGKILNENQNSAKLERISAIYDTVASYQRTLEDLIKKAVILIDLTQSQSSKLKRFNPNDQVVVRPSDDYILAIVIKSLEGGKKYEVEDAEDDELDGQRKRYTFPVQNIIPLANKKKELQPKSKCLALYPNSTCFYPATICATPAMNRDPSHPNHYILQFNDDNSMERFVEENYVIEFPKRI
ncbi:hypothetical protein HDU92_004529 [Lobulomyces angularis]|nr:hypothetical protein HDU92_004529 [Lobulomyces angularis]